MNQFRILVIGDNRMEQPLRELNVFHATIFLNNLDALEVVRFPKLVREALRGKIERSSDPQEIVTLQAKLNAVAVDGDDTARAKGEALAQHLAGQLRDKIKPVIATAKEVLAEIKGQVEASEEAFFAQYQLPRQATAVSALVGEVERDLDRLEYGLHPEPGQPTPRASASSFAWHLRWFRLQD